MQPRTRWYRLACLSFAVVALAVPYYFAVRPWYLHWGATQSELTQALPGDEIVRRARIADVSTRAITIDAAASAVWPWLAQIGQDRGGFYSFELLEDLVGCEMENADRLHPEFQTWQPGDKLWMYPPHELQGLGHALLVDFEPGRAMGFATRQIGTGPSEPYDGSWSFVVEPLDARRTRLIVRGRGGADRGAFAAAFDRLIFEPVHFVMERKMMHGIKARAEGRSVSEAEDVGQIVLWTLTVLIALWSVVRALGSRKPLHAVSSFVAAGIVFQLLTFAQPNLALSTMLVVALATWAIGGARGASVRRHSAVGDEHGARAVRALVAREKQG